jgi:glycosyltransferase involved in cell wall biosynthesis
MPRVSVVIPTFNCARFLGRSISSVLAQTYTDHEIIVVDDGSTDETNDVVCRFAERVQYLYQPNRGLSAARNVGLCQASGELIAYVDADDMWYPHKLAKQVAFLDARKECGLVHSDATIIDEADEVIHYGVNQETGREFPQGHCLMDLLRRCHIQILTVVERRDCIERVGRFDERLKTAQDYLHWLRIAMEGRAFGYIPEPLAIYRRTGGSLSSSPRRLLEDLVIIFEDLLSEKCLLVKYGQDAVEIVRSRLYTVRRELAYLDRVEGWTGNSVMHIISLIRRWPLRAELYVDLVKASIRAVLVSRLRTLK